MNERGQFATARFLYISDEPERPARRGASRNTTHVGWRIVAGNNRPLGRSVRAYPSLAECAKSATRLHERINQATTAMHFDVADGQWRWTVHLDGQPTAISAHGYMRRIECTRALRQFIDAVATAEPEPDVLHRLGPNALSDYLLIGDPDSGPTAMADAT